MISFKKAQQYVESLLVTLPVYKAIVHEAPKLKKFDWDLKIHKDNIPDPQNFHHNTHAKIRLPKVGITNLNIPINVKRRDDNKPITVKGTVSAYVSMDDTESRGINMSRLARCLYNNVNEKGEVGLLDLLKVVDDYKRTLPAKDGYLKVRFDYPYLQKHWREPHTGWLYYPVELEIKDVGDVCQTFLTVTYTYNSGCPCSYALSEFSRNELDIPATPHSQRSEATIKVLFDPSNEDLLWIEDVIDLCRHIQPSEVLSGVVTRVGELSMAQMVASVDSIGFIEDLLRKFWEGFNNEPRVLDFCVGLAHYESLNSNFANGFINKSLDVNTGLY